MSALLRDSVVHVEDITLGHGDVVVQEHLSFAVRAGEVFAILGPSGSGKSTLLRAMIGLDCPRRGRILLLGKDVTRARGEERSRLLRQLGVSFQGGALFGSMSLLENVRLPLDELTELDAAERELVARAKLAQVGLGDDADKMPAELSGGMQKRAAIARAMALDPSMLFLDEPSAGLDPIASAGLDRLVRELSQGSGITVVMVTHDLESAHSVADRCMLLDKEARTAIAEGRPADLRDRSSDPRVRRFFRRELEPNVGAIAI